MGLFEDGVERRMLLGPTIVGKEQPVLDELWPLYYDSQNIYNRLLKVKLEVDKDHVFTPNLFCVGATQCPRFAR